MELKYVSISFPTPPYSDDLFSRMECKIQSAWISSKIIRHIPKDTVAVLAIGITDNIFRKQHADTEAYLYKA